MTALETILQHKTIRKFKSDAIPEDILNSILEAGLRSYHGQHAGL